MIIIMEPGATDAQVNSVDTRLKELGFRTILNKGDVLTVVAAIGDKRLIQPDVLGSMDGVKNVMPIQEPFKLAGRTAHPADTVITFDNGVKLGAGHKPVMMAGPCSVESDPALLLQIAHAVKAGGAEFLRGGAFKPRTSPYDFQGLEEEGLKLMAKAREETGLLVVTEVMDSAEVPMVAEYADMLQVGARNMQNFKLLKAVGSQNKPVMLKRGLSATMKEFFLAAEYILYHGNEQVVLCERGIRSFDSGYTRNVMDLAAVPVVKKHSHLPIIIDPSHGTGQRYLITPMLRAALAVGADGLMVEVHPNPDKALSDGHQSLTLDMFDQMLKDIAPMLELTNKLYEREAVTV